MPGVVDKLRHEEPWWLKYSALLITWIVAGTIWVISVPTMADVREETKSVVMEASIEYKEMWSSQLTTISVQFAGIQSSQSDLKDRLDRLERRINDFIDDRSQ